mgnify:FL=1
MKEDGIGDLYKKYEELKAKLAKEGLFDEKHKKPIPFMPKTIGVLTSKTGSVIKDIINVSTRRNPNVHIKLYPVPVQGPGAEREIAEAIRVMNEKKLADVLILARGGGSLEDLWPFNEEITARAIYESEIPIISAVGHETDFTIADFVADLRAPTPSAAAELAQADVREIKIKLETYQNRYKNALKKKIEYMKLRYNKAMASRVFTQPLQNINEQYLNIDIKIKKLENIMKMKLKESQKRQIELISKLDALSPLKTLTRGYCLAEENGEIIKSAKSLKTNDIVNLKFYDGERQTKIIWFIGGKEMGKKILYVVVIVVLIVAGIFVAKQISEKDGTKQTGANTLENTNKINRENKLEESNTVVEEPEKNEVKENNVAEGKDDNAPEEQAKQIVKENWGEDETVYFSYDGKDENGKYIICVREKETTKALYWYYVDVETGTFDIK